MKRKISNQFLANYLLMFIISGMLSLCAFLLLSFAGSVLEMNLEKNKYTAQQLMKDEYTKIDYTQVVENGGGLQIIDQTGRVLLTKGINTIEKDTLTMSELTAFFTQSKQVGMPFSYSIAYNENKAFWLIVTFPTSVRIDIALAHNSQYPSQDNDEVNAAIIAVVIFYLLLLMGVTFIYSKLSSISIIKPLRELSDSVRLFRDGNYSIRVNLKQKNEFKEIQDVFNDMAQRIEEERTIKDLFENNRKKLIADISHDLKTPLSNILGYADLLLNDAHLSDEKRREFLNTIYVNSTRANNLITDMFELSKLDSPEFKLRLLRTDVCEFLREQVIELLPVLEQSGYTLDWRIPQEEIFKELDAKHMSRVFQNLAANTLHHTPIGTHVVISLEKTNEAVIITYKDNGGGIPCDQADTVFDPFIRGDASRHSEGTGLGLAIVKKIILAHGGDIRLINDAGHCSTFVITLNN